MFLHCGGDPFRNGDQFRNGRMMANPDNDGRACKRATFEPSIIDPVTRVPVVGGAVCQNFMQSV